MKEEIVQIDSLEEVAKQCSLIAKDEDIDAIGISVNNEYWIKIDQEIKKL